MIERVYEIVVEFWDVFALYSVVFGVVGTMSIREVFFGRR